jgi:hypothetical protein
MTEIIPHPALHVLSPADGGNEEQSYAELNQLIGFQIYRSLITDYQVSPPPFPFNLFTQGVIGARHRSKS